MIINGLPLPTTLCRLLETRTWRLPEDTAALQMLTGVETPDDFTFLDFDGMARETAAAHSLAADPTTARLYGLKPVAGSARLVVDEPLLDTARAVMIAVNWDEDAICLDYRETAAPSVVLSAWNDHAGNATWRRIAVDFDEFARRIGLQGA